MIDASREKRGSLLDRYCLQLGTLIEHRHTELALGAARQQAETAAALARDAMLQAQTAERTKTKFLANMTHELRTPLNAIIGFSELIGAGHEHPKPDYPEYAKYIREAGIHLLGIVNGVLELARIEAGKLQLEDQFVALGEVVGSALRASRSAAEKKMIAVDSALEIDGLVRMDPARMKQVFTNLLSNAIKFTEPGGAVRVASGLADDGALTVTIVDNGIGIPLEHLDKVLEPFGQVEDHLTRQNEGPGLGLPIARALIELHGGALSLSSEVGGGTTVEVRLPHDRVGPRETMGFA